MSGEGVSYGVVGEVVGGIWNSLRSRYIFSFLLPDHILTLPPSPTLLPLPPSPTLSYPLPPSSSSSSSSFSSMRKLLKYPKDATYVDLTVTFASDPEEVAGPLVRYYL